jgi:hypothetical protein
MEIRHVVVPDQVLEGGTDETTIDVDRPAQPRAPDPAVVDDASNSTIAMMAIRS